MRAWLVLLAACGAKPPEASWVERDTHAEAHAVEHASGGPIDASKIDAMSEAELADALSRAGDEAPAGKLALRAARLAHHRGDDAAARMFVARAASATDADRAALAALGAELAEPPVDGNAICVLLPLTGRFASVGVELRAAIEVAPAAGTKWVMLDTKGEPDGAVAAVDQAVAKGCAGILGPAGTREAIAAAREAMLHAIPIALLAPEDGADPSAGVFRLAWSPADEARAVAKMAADDSFPTVGVFAPRDDVGQEAAAAFVDAATSLGLSVTAQGSYDPTGGDLEPDVKQFLDLVPAHNARLAEHLAKHGKKGWASFSPDIPYSLLYIPDRYDRAALVAAFLPYYNVELRSTDFPDQGKLARKHGGRLPQVVQLVGGGGWHHPSLPVRGGSAVQGALIVDVWGDALGPEATTSFMAEFQQRTGHAASSVAAEAYDAATIVAAARHTVGNAPDVRAALTRELAHARLDDGACGPAVIGPDGELARDATVLEVQGDELIMAP